MKEDRKEKAARTRACMSGLQSEIDRIIPDRGEQQHPPLERRQRKHSGDAARQQLLHFTNNRTLHCRPEHLFPGRWQLHGKVGFLHRKGA